MTPKQFTLIWKCPAIDGLPKKPGKDRYEQIPCLCIRRHGVEILQWNCEHLCWDGQDGDDYECDPCAVFWYAEIPDEITPSPKEAEDAINERMDNT